MAWQIGAGWIWGNISHSSVKKIKFWICWSCCFLRLKIFSDHVWILKRVKTKVLSICQNKRKFVIFQVTENTKFFPSLFWIFVGLKSNVILGSKQMFLHMVWSLKQIWVICNDVFSPFFFHAWELHVSFFIPDSEVLCAYIQQ